VGVGVGVGVAIGVGVGVGLGFGLGLGGFWLLPSARLISIQKEEKSRITRIRQNNFFI
jgi:hypothetical protein